MPPVGYQRNFRLKNANESMWIQVAERECELMSKINKVAYFSYFEILYFTFRTKCSLRGRTMKTEYYSNLRKNEFVKLLF